ncbi:VOC family protein [Herbiconiux flava]|uniref:PhnB protein n=1 Tax=Herbiconiux flava TaxID=881268 RepID=A0A852SHR9_9MICO|nr:VOC family protein [Herbiconiux flava]NYD69214.1 PhnB protein [Herbiconiux flava]GLK15963.1 VOC family protein [Herbiconiux flava]
MTTLNPYINFRGQAKEAAEFYQSVFGGELGLSTFGDFGMPVEPGEEHLVMHAQLTTASGLVLMLSDTPTHMELNVGNNISVSLSGGPGESDELHGYFDRLAEGGTVTEPLVEAPWGDSFGMVVDRFGINWLVNIGGAPQEQEQ